MSEINDLARGTSIVLSWQRWEDPGIVATRIYRRGEGADDFEAVGDFTGNEARIDGLVPHRRYRFAAAGVDALGTEDPFEEWVQLEVAPTVTEVGPALPATVTGLGASQDGALVRARWAPAEDAVTVAYEVREGDWDDGRLVGRVAEPAIVFPWAAPVGTAGMLSVRGVDSIGRYSAASAEVDYTVKAMEDFVLDATHDLHGGGFSGTLSGVEVDGGDLVLAEVGEAAANTGEAAAATFAAAVRRDSGTYTTAWMDIGAVITERLEADLRWTVEDHAGLEAADALGMVGGQVGVGVNRRPAAATAHAAGGLIGPADVLLEVETSEDSGTPSTTSGWMRFVPGTYRCRQYRFRITLRGSGIVYPKVTECIVYRRRKNKKDEGTIATAGSPGPTAITFTAPFTVAPVVVAGVVGGTGFAVKADTITTSGANLRAYDTAGTEVFTGTLHWHAMGT